uniref:Ig-like domain-containing protein n=1 Tax=Stegastes partitus TaxID=144197 RepID=A0A3B5ADM5_9TELE
MSTPVGKGMGVGCLVALEIAKSNVIVEGSSVTLSCSSDANPAANNTWYKENQMLLREPGTKYKFTSISSKDRGIYYCKAENRHGHINSISLFLHVQCKLHFNFLIPQFFHKYCITLLIESISTQNTLLFTSCSKASLCVSESLC